MTDNQETKTALEMSECDIENYADDCDVERELKESDEVSDSQELLNIGNVIHNIGCKYQSYEECSEILSSIASKLWDLSLDIRIIEEKEKAARERDEAVNIMVKCAGYVSTAEEFRSNKLSPELDAVFESMFDIYDAGYRKQ